MVRRKRGQRRRVVRTWWRPSHKRWLARYAEALLPFLFVVVMTAMYMSLLAAFYKSGGGQCYPMHVREYLQGSSFQGATLCPAPVAPVSRPQTWPARVLWVFMTGVNLLTCLLAFLLGCAVISSAFKGRSGGYPRLRALGLVSGLTLLFGLGFSLIPTEAYLRQLQELVECTVRGDLSNIMAVTKWTIVTGYTTACFLILACCAVLWPPRGLGRQSALELARRMRLMRFLLYVGAATLITNVLRLSALFRWALALLPGPEYNSTTKAMDPNPVTKLLESYTSALTSSEAGAYTLLLASVFIPALWILRRRADRLVSRQKLATLPEQEDWLKKQGLAFSFSEYLPRLAAILGPLLAGPLADIIGRLGK